MRHPLRSFVTALVLGLLWAPSIGAQCLEAGLDAMRASIEGEPFSLEEARKCLPRSMDRPPPGSGNWPHKIHTGLAISGHHDGRVLLPWLLGQNGWGHNGAEDGSTIYEHYTASAAVALLHRAPEAQVRDAARLYLRAQWAKAALHSASEPPRTVHRWQSGQKYRRSRVNYMNHRGPWVAMPGERQQEKPAGQLTGRWSDVTPMHAALAWAAGVDRRWSVDLSARPSGWSLLPWTIARMTGSRSVRDEIAPGDVGLSAEERQALRAFLADPTSPEKARAIATWLEPYPQRRSIVREIRRYRSGAVASAMSQTRNGNKGGCPIVATKGHETWSLCPGPYKGVGAFGTRGLLEAGRAVAIANNGDRIELPLKGWGEVAWVLRWSQSGVTVSDESGEIEPVSGQPPDSPGTSPPPVSPGPTAPPPPIFEGVDPRYWQATEIIFHLLSRPDISMTESRLLGTLGECLRRVALLSDSGTDRDAMLGRIARCGRRTDQLATEAREGR